MRNQGDEGYCSTSIWDLGLEDYTFHLPWRTGATSVSVDWGKTFFSGTDGTSGPNLAVTGRRDGVYVTSSWALLGPTGRELLFRLFTGCSTSIGLEWWLSRPLLRAAFAARLAGLL